MGNYSVKASMTVELDDSAVAGALGEKLFNDYGIEDCGTDLTTDERGNTYVADNLVSNKRAVAVLVDAMNLLKYGKILSNGEPVVLFE